MSLFKTVDNEWLKASFDLRDSKLLGQGAYGVVFTGIDKKTKKVVALKRMTRRAAANKEVVILSAVRTQAACARYLPCLLDHFKYLDPEENKMYYFIVQELVKGRDLFDLVHKKLLNDKDREIIVKETATALRMIHSRGIIHNDLKIENIMYDRGAGSVMLDFGLSCAAIHTQEVRAATRREKTVKDEFLRRIMRVAKNDEQAHIMAWRYACSLEDMYVGTMAYFSPDRYAIHKKQYSVTSTDRVFSVLRAGDVYALGIIYYELYSGGKELNNQYPKWKKYNVEWSNLRKLPTMIQETEWNLRVAPNRGMLDLVRKMLSTLPTARPTSAAVERAVTEEIRWQ